jgi:hypothetical protein
MIKDVQSTSTCRWFLGIQDVKEPTGVVMRLLLPYLLWFDRFETMGNHGIMAKAMAACGLLHNMSVDAAIRSHVAAGLERGGW